MSEKIVKILEKELKDKELTVEEQIKIISRPSIHAELDKLFKEKSFIQMSQMEASSSLWDKG